MDKPWEGQHIWLFMEELTKDRAEELKGLGVQGVLLKYHDGRATVMRDKTDFRAKFNRQLPIAKNAGLIVGAWGYLYHNAPEEEGKLALESLSSGADWYIADSEIEVEQLDNNIEATRRFFETIRSKNMKAAIGYSPFPYAMYHKDFPYEEYNAYCNVVMPQMYWGGIGDTPGICFSKTITQLGMFNTTIPIAPAGQAHSVPLDEIYEFRDVCSRSAGISWWDYDLIKSDTNRLKALFGKPTGTVYHKVQEPTIKFGNSGGMVTLLQHILHIPSSGMFDGYTKERVEKFQAANGLDKDGIVGPVTWSKLMWKWEQDRKLYSETLEEVDNSIQSILDSMKNIADGVAAISKQQ